MFIPTPTEIAPVAWEGELVAPPVSYGGRAERPYATIGAPERWPAADVLANDAPGGPPGVAWTPPLGGAEFWLLRLACTLRAPQAAGRSARLAAGAARITEATQSLYLRPANAGAPAEGAYAYSLYPDQESVESEVEFKVSLGPELAFAPGVKAKLGELGATFPYRWTYPVIQAYKVGTPAPYWEFKAHATRPLEGSQFTYAVVAARPGSGGVRGTVALRVTVQSQWGKIRYGPPEEAHEHLSFTLP
jgi:hypothetical protein